MGGGSRLARENCAVLLLPNFEGKKGLFSLFAPKGETRALSTTSFAPSFFSPCDLDGKQIDFLFFSPLPFPPAAAVVLVRLKDLFLPFCEALFSLPKLGGERSNV